MRAFGSQLTADVPDFSIFFLVGCDGHSGLCAAEIGQAVRKHVQVLRSIDYYLFQWTVLYVEFANIQCLQERLRPVTGTVN